MQTWAIVTDGVAWSACVSACVLVTTVNTAKTDEPIEMLFGGRLAWAQETCAKCEPRAATARGTFKNMGMVVHGDEGAK